MKNLEVAGYNERLFGGGVRKYLHTARYRWLVSRLQRLKVIPDSVLELGCFDGKLIEFLPTLPSRYSGFDANWEGGLEIARERWRDHPAYQFMACATPQEMAVADSESFDVSVTMETLEHMAPQMASEYLARLARHTSKYLFVTVPNEKGPLFLAKWIIKRLLTKDADQHTARELWNTTIGRLERAEPYGHKGFDYQDIVQEISKHFRIVEMSGLPFELLPAWLGFTVGIIARPK